MPVCSAAPYKTCVLDFKDILQNILRRIYFMYFKDSHEIRGYKIRKFWENRYNILRSQGIISFSVDSRIACSLQVSLWELSSMLLNMQVGPSSSLPERTKDSTHSTLTIGLWTPAARFMIKDIEPCYLSFQKYFLESFLLQNTFGHYFSLRKWTCSPYVPPHPVQSEFQEKFQEI